MNTFTEIWNWWYGNYFYMEDSRVTYGIPNGLWTMWILFTVAWIVLIGRESYDSGINDLEDCGVMFILLPALAFIFSLVSWVAMPIVLPIVLVAGFCVGLSALGKHHRAKERIRIEK